VKVLVYEEDESRIELLRENLNQEDYDVIFARSGEALFVFLEDEMPDLIVSNFELPRGGYDLANAILARVKRPFPYVLFLTEKKSEKYVVDCLGPIPGDFVSLPLREEALQARIVVAEKAIALQEYLRSQDSAPPELAMYDPETNLLNKQAVFDRGLVEVSRSHRENQTVGVAMMELINVDAIRNQRGDELAALAVRFIANTLRANLRMYDIVGRWTPACFLVLIPGVPTENTGSVVTRLYEAVSEIKITLMDDSLLELQLAAGFTCANQGDELPFAEIVGRSEKAVSGASRMDEGPRVMSFSQIE
jgi:diguanylate cyclase (GGDEF)-like protein